MELYAYANGNPISYTDPLGLWSVTAGGYWGAGGEVTVGNDEGQWFLTMRFGYGIGGGWYVDPEGKIPGSEPADRTCGGAVLSVSGQAGANLGPYGVGTELGVAHNYRDRVSSVYGSPPGFSIAGEFLPELHAGVSVGGQITLYKGARR